MHSNCLLVVVATMIYGQKWRDAEVRRNFGVLTLSFQMARRRPVILQRLPFSSACHSPAPNILQRLPFSSDYHSPATAILQRLLFSSHSYSTAAHDLSPTIL